MAVEKHLNREQTFEVDAATPPAGLAWTAVAGIVTPGASAGSTDADTTDADSAGFDEHLKSQRNYSFTLETFVLEDDALGTYDAGQTHLNTLANAVGAAATGSFRYTTVGGNVYTFSGTVDAPIVGAGGQGDAAKRTYTIKQTGAGAWT